MFLAVQKKKHGFREEGRAIGSSFCDFSSGSSSPALFSLLFYGFSGLQSTIYSPPATRFSII